LHSRSFLAASILVASTISVEVGFSVALIELGLGVVVGNATSVSIPDWLASSARSPEWC